MNQFVYCLRLIFLMAVQICTALERFVDEMIELVFYGEKMIGFILHFLVLPETGFENPRLKKRWPVHRRRPVLFSHRAKRRDGSGFEIRNGLSLATGNWKWRQGMTLTSPGIRI